MTASKSVHSGGRSYCQEGVRQVQINGADAFVHSAWPHVARVRAAGITDLRGIAQALNDRGVRTARGGSWHVSNVKNLLDRARAKSLS